MFSTQDITRNDAHAYNVNTYAMIVLTHLYNIVVKSKLVLHCVINHVAVHFLQAFMLMYMYLVYLFIESFEGKP